MFWHMGISTESPVETILDKEAFTLDELLDEDEIIQECKAVNGRLINFLCERAQVKQLVEYIVEEASEDANEHRSLKFPFVACEIFTCEIDVILKALVEDKELMDLLFSFLDPERPHSIRLAGYFSQVAVCLFHRRTIPLMNYVRAHLDIIRNLIDLIGITSIMEVLIRLIGADEHLYVAYGDSMQWLEDINVLDMIVDKFSLSDHPEVHANAAKTLCTLIQYAPPDLASKISSQSFIGMLFRVALDDSRPKSVLVNLLSVCMSLLNPKKFLSLPDYTHKCRKFPGSAVAADPEIVGCMLESLASLVKLLDHSYDDRILLTTYGKLKPPLGKHRLKIIEFISGLVDVSGNVTVMELLRFGALDRILELFFEYPFNNFLHHHVEQILTVCIRSKNDQVVDHLLCKCNLIGKLLESETKSTLATDADKPTAPTEGRLPPRLGNIGHLTRIANKLIQQANSNTNTHTLLQGNAEWVDWESNVLLSRNAVENVHHWACGRPTMLQDHQMKCVKDEGLYLDDESTKLVFSSLRLGDDPERVRLVYT